jgi:uncharacterized protein YoxC
MVTFAFVTTWWADTGALLVGMAAIGTLFINVVRGMRRNAQVLDSIDSTLNHVGEPVAPEGPTLGQRVKAIDDRVDRIDRKLDNLSINLGDLSAAMLDHINEEARRVQRIEERVNTLDRRKDWGTD